MFAGYGQELLVDGKASHLLRQDRQYKEAQIQLAGLLGGMNGRSQLGGRLSRSDAIAAHTAAELDLSARKPSADVRIISCSSLNLNSMGLPCGDYWDGQQSGGL